MTPLQLTAWAQRWGVPSQAVGELLSQMGVNPTATSAPGKSEGAAQQLIRLDGAKRRVPLWRNNVGATQDANGRFIRFGLANESKAVNEVIKSGDLIGITPYTISVVDVGSTIGVFTSIEVKKPGWKYAGTEREIAQLAWIQLITSLGGRAQFATTPGDIWQD